MLRGTSFPTWKTRTNIKSWSFPRGAVRAPVPGAEQPRLKPNMPAQTDLSFGAPLVPATSPQVLTAGFTGEDQMHPPGSGGRGAPGVPVQGLLPPNSPELLPVNAHDTHFTGEQNEVQKRGLTSPKSQSKESAVAGSLPGILSPSLVNARAQAGPQGPREGCWRRQCPAAKLRKGGPGRPETQLRGFSAPNLGRSGQRAASRSQQSLYLVYRG